MPSQSFLSRARDEVKRGGKRNYIQECEWGYAFLFPPKNAEWYAIKILKR